MDFAIETKTVLIDKQLVKRRGKSHAPLNMDGRATVFRVTDGKRASVWTTWAAEADAWREILNAGNYVVAARLSAVEA